MAHVARHAHQRRYWQRAYVRLTYVQPVCDALCPLVRPRFAYGGGFGFGYLRVRCDELVSSCGSRRRHAV